MSFDLEGQVQEHIEKLRTPEQVVAKTTDVGRLVVGNKIAEIGGQFERTFKNLYNKMEGATGMAPLQKDVHFEKDAWGNELVVSGSGDNEVVQLQTQYMEPHQRQAIEKRTTGDTDQTNIRSIGRHLEPVPQMDISEPQKKPWLRFFRKS